VLLLCWRAVVADNYEFKSAHQKIQEEAFLDFSNDNLSGDPAEAANQVAHRLAASVENRLETIFQRAKTPECRAKIAGTLWLLCERHRT
jgi:ATP-dependent exoDNAse (exonuclease V) beta subunit